MKLSIVRTKKEKREVIRFIYDLYRDDPQFCDMNLTFVKTFLYQTDAFSRRCKVIPIRITDKGQIALTGIFVLDETPEIKLSFPEFIPHAAPFFSMLERFCQKLLTTYRKEKVIIGVNGQISYGLGILTGDCDRTFEFNSNYNKDYYTKELDAFFPVVKKAYAYRYDPAHTLSMIDPKLLAGVKKSYSFRYLDLWHLKRDLLIFGSLCHESLQSTPYYAEKKPAEMCELMLKMRWLLKKEDIIFAMQDGKEVGFLFTHPDYAELFDKPRLHYLPFYLRFLTKRTKKVIFNVIGVLPDHQASGVAVALIDRAVRMRKQKYDVGVSSFILEENIPSTKLCRKLSLDIHKEFHLYEITKKEHV